MAFEFRDVRVPRQGFVGGDVIWCTHVPDDAGEFVHTACFGPGSGPIGVAAGGDAMPLRHVGFGDAVMITARTVQPDYLPFVAAHQPLKALSHPADLDFFADQNVGLAVHNLEDAHTIIAWLQYHVTCQGMTAALIICRQRASLGDVFAKHLCTAAQDIKGLERLLLWSSDVPLGKPDLPSEAHPFTVRGAPGKSRMGTPAPDPQVSPLGQFQIYDMMQHAYLARARAVMNIDVHDLITEAGPSVFDRAVDSDTGLITLKGQQCYPWKATGTTAAFGDHIYVPFDADHALGRWCVRPAVGADAPIWRIVRVAGRDISGAAVEFHRFMALKHPVPQVAKLVPKSSLVLSDALKSLSQQYFNHSPIYMPVLETSGAMGKSGTAIVTTMKNEGPFILEWVAYHRAIGVDRISVYTNDCTDGTDTLLDMLQAKGYLKHQDNKFQGSGLKPQHHAFRLAEDDPYITSAEWIICMDVDEYITIKVGDGTLAALYDYIGDANMVALNWRLFGNADVHAFKDQPITEQFTQCAAEYTRKPHQAWGFKTLFRNEGIFKKLGVHRPKGLKPQLWDTIHWLNGSGKPIPKEMFRNAWRSNVQTYGYDVVQLNHYAVRSAESFLVKRDRGRVNQVEETRFQQICKENMDQRQVTMGL
ncbi:MAG: glycosyltransferase family 2 protein [Pseudomonadota bacterium]